MTDRDVRRIDFTPRRTTVRALGRLRRPARLPNDRRAGVAELRVYCVEALVIDEPSTPHDGDMHVILRDPTSPRLSLIAEFPSPNCAAVCVSPWVGAMAEARRRMERAFSTMRDTLRIFVVGVGLFDRPHNQIGPAANYFELHPVLAVRLP